MLEHSPDRIRLKVPCAEVIAVCKVLLERLPVDDIAIKDISVEDVIRNIFAGRPGGDTTFHYHKVAHAEPLPA